MMLKQCKGGATVEECLDLVIDGCYEAGFDMFLLYKLKSCSIL